MSNLPIIVDPGSPINIKAQIIGQVQLLIALNELKSGDTLPTVVEFAKHLGVNHNTVAAVYNDLIESGYLIAQRGKGTFVSSNEIVKKSRSHQHIYALLAEAYDLAAQFGLSASEFGVAAYSQALLSSRTVDTPLKVVFVATKQYEKDICEAISSEIGVPLSFLPWSESKANSKKSQLELKAAELVITTAQLLWSVTSSSTPDIEVFAIDVKPELELLIQLSSLPRHAHILLVAEEKAESEAMKVSLEKAGIHYLNLQAIDKKDLQQNPEILEQAELVIVSRLVENYVRQQLTKVDRVMVFNFHLDLDNISLLKARLAAIQSSRSTVSS
ncbi:MAG: GntR family transcriptional regulator [Pleurocapsa sp. MO_192.B19]|nr:GntR family transcriptional regulator [Pleurocapsa sp. MO_192.B19]